MTNALPESTNIVVVGGGKFPREKDFDITVNLGGELDFRSKQMGFDAYDPREVHEVAPWEKAFEAAAVPKDEVDSQVRESEDKVVKQLSNVACAEGYVQLPEEVSWRFVYIRDSDWVKISEQYPNDNVDESIGGLAHISHTIYIRYPNNQNLSPQAKVHLGLTQLHEGRHRVGGKNVWLNLTDVEISNPTVEDEDIVVDLSNAVIRQSNAMERFIPQMWEKTIKNPSGHNLEEIFVCGYCSENFESILEQELLNQHIIQMREMGIPTEYASLFRGDLGDQNGVIYKEYLEIYHFMKKRIPNILEIMGQVRAGRRGSRNLLARKIIQEFGQIGLKNLIYAEDSLESIKKLSQLMQTLSQLHN